MKQLSFHLESCGKNIVFRLGTNLQWVELHLVEEYNSNIEVGQTIKYTQPEKVQIFVPYLELKKSEMNTILRLGGDE